MACVGCSCSTGKDDSAPSGCNSNGGCATGGCNRRNTYDWISAQGITDAVPYDVVEVSFKNGAHKYFFKNPSYTRAVTGDMVCVEAQSGYDIGQVSLSGELVRLQMKKKRVRPDTKFGSVIRIANDRDMEKLDYVRSKEHESLVLARAISRSLKLDMKIGDVEYQGDGRKATFYYTADGRVDFRELIRSYAREFKVKIEMRQIGMRQESALIGGLGNCGRELCCSTWLTNFKSVNTAAARYQNLAINQTKLTGMCGRLKCCLNFELDSYLDALEEFPDRADNFYTEEGKAILIKTDVFKRLMYYTYANNRGRLFPLGVEQVWEVLDKIKSGVKPVSLSEIEALGVKDEPEEEVYDFENVHNVIQLPEEVRKKKKRKNKRKNPSARTRAQEELNAKPLGKKADSGNDRSSQDNKSNTTRRPDRNNKPQRAERGEKPNRPQQRTDRPQRPERSDRPDRPVKKKGPRPEQKPKGDIKPKSPSNPNVDARPKNPNTEAKSPENKQNSDQKPTNKPTRRYPTKKKGRDAKPPSEG